MTRTLLLLAVAAIGAPAVTFAAPPATGGKGVPALYATRTEAEKAARLHFHCSGAHKMGNQWMPCDEHAKAGGGHHGEASH